MKNYDEKRKLLRLAGWCRRDRSGPGKLRTKNRHENIHVELWYPPESISDDWRTYSFEKAWKRYLKEKN
jgi:hypothetical protein